jgi:hypothetical protein
MGEEGEVRVGLPFTTPLKPGKKYSPILTPLVAASAEVLYTIAPTPPKLT